MSFVKCRERVGLSQAEVAKRVEVDQSTVCLWETNKTRPRVTTLLKLARLYDCTLDELLEDNSLTSSTEEILSKKLSNKKDF